MHMSWQISTDNNGGLAVSYTHLPEQADNFPDKDTYRKYGKGKELKQWRRDNITDIVHRLYTDIKTIKPWVKVSSSPCLLYTSRCV